MKKSVAMVLSILIIIAMVLPIILSLLNVQ